MVEWLQHISLPLILGIVKMSSRIEFPGFFFFLTKRSAWSMFKYSIASFSLFFDFRVF